MSLMYHDTVIAGTPVIDSTPTAGSNHAVSSGGVKSAITKVEDDIAIRVVGNKTTYASGAAIGQYVIVSGSTITGISDGMYKAAKAIPYNTVIDSTYLTAVSGGAANDLKSAIDVSENGVVTAVPNPGVTVTVTGAKVSSVKYLRFTISNTSLSFGTALCVLPQEWYPLSARPYLTAYNYDTGAYLGYAVINPNDGSVNYWGASTSATVIINGLYI